MASIKQKEITAALNSFYQRPVAMVSLELLLSIGLVIFLAVFAIQPTLLTMVDLVKEREEKIELVDKLKAKVATLGSAQLLYQQAQPKLSQLEEAIPSQPQLMRSLKIIEKLASENAVIIESVSVPTIPTEAPVADSKIKVTKVDLPVRVSITGEFLDIRAFIQTLQNSRRSFVINTVTFSLEENRGERKLRANISLSQPYMGVPEL